MKEKGEKHSKRRKKVRKNKNEKRKLGNYVTDTINKISYMSKVGIPHH